ncbi:basigin isoform X2 [Nilaparvata lugens]|uniref:basigin isoform X2 n=1 Tax=Nilaparvata lugens TaxID=108931 RepID=UPI00193C92DB|nr:basigin isoform X2 [Nilaparvata lugens]
MFLVSFGVSLSSALDINRCEAAWRLLQKGSSLSSFWLIDVVYVCVCIGNIYEGNSTVKVGEPFSIVCRLSLAEAVHWQRNNVPIGRETKFENPRHSYNLDEREENNAVFARLSVSAAAPGHAGAYRCHPHHTQPHHLYVVADSSKLHANFDFQPYKVMDLAAQFHMHCNITDQTLANSKPEYKWYKDNELLKTTNKDGKPYLEVSGKNLRILKPSLDDIGNYWCHVYVNGTEQSKIMIEVIVKPYVKLTSQLTFIEGEELKIECAIQAKPTPAVMWKFEDIEYRESKDRVELRTSSAGIPNAMFVIKNTEKSDRGNYTCLAINTEPQVGITDQVTGSSVSYVRIKDKFAALWPFLGICVEVIVLCAIIFVYEKKRNKAELEESDTDQSPEQKNTPDHGKESVRQRK